jgi:hypothetical protein
MSEKNALEARATAGQQAWKDAVQRLEALSEGLSAKVRLRMLVLASSMLMPIIANGACPSHEGEGRIGQEPRRWGEESRGKGF